MNKTKENVMSAILENNHLYSEGALNRPKSKPLTNILRAIFGPLNEWSIFERYWLVVFAVLSIVTFAFSGGGVLGLIASITGMLSVILVAKGRISNYFFGVIQAIIYGYISYTYAIYGEVMLNLMYYLPMNIIGFFIWKKNKVDDSNSINGEQVTAKRMTKKEMIVSVLVVSIAIVLYATLLSSINGSVIGVDSATTILSVYAMILMVKRYAEQWIIWIIVNALSIIMWLIAISYQGGDDYSMVIMWSAFLVNSIYGYINWMRISKPEAIRN